ncbi:MAG: hypothetical protein KBA51_09285 [Kiritimatiellae bacterium]|nr:hypothetical protein [Kiritimatiellia bacterium]
MKSIVSPDVPSQDGRLGRARGSFLAPVVVLVFWAMVAALWAGWTTDHTRQVFREDGGVEVATVMLYIVAAILLAIPKLCRHLPPLSRIALLLLMIGAAAREMDFHKLVGDYSVFKVGFYLKSDIPIFHRLIAFCGVAAIFGSGLYIAVRHARDGWRALRSGEPWAWTVGTMIAAGAISKIADRSVDVLSSALGVTFSQSSIALIQAFEESTELLLPALVILAILQAARRREAAVRPAAE